MAKILGALLIIIACTWGGMKVSETYRKRAELFRQLQNGLNLLETEISYSATPLPLALKRVGGKLRGESGLVFARASLALERDRGFSASEAWGEGIAYLQEHIKLNKEETDILVLFGQALGGSSKEDQLNNIALTRRQLYLLETAANEAREKNQKMWQYLGFCTGAVIVLILI